MKDGNNSVNIPTNEALEYLSGNETLAGLITQVPLTVYTDSTNILGIVVFSVVFGIVIGRYRSKCQVLIDFIEASEFAIVKIVMVIIWFSPIGILFLIAGQIVAISDPVTEMKRLGWYMLTVVAGLTIHGLVTLLLILGLLGRRNPFKFIAGMSQALLTAVGTSSSSATMPLTMRCLEENLDVDTRIVRFMIPLGATVNMDGTALYEAVACIYIAQYAGITLTLGEVILTSLTATVASIGAAGLPGAGLITLMMVLMAVNLPADLFILIVPVDWFLDRVRTTINVLGDAIGCAVVQQMCKTHLHSVDSMAQLVHTQSSNTPAPGESIDPEQPIQGIHPTSVAGTPMFHDTNEVRDAKGSQTNINVPTDPVTKTEEPRTSSAVSQGKTSSNLGGLLTSSEHKDIGKDNGSVCSTGWQSRNGEFDVVPLAISDSLASVAMHNASSQSSLPGAPK